LGFAEGLALGVGAKPNVPLVRLAKIVFEKCGEEKKYKTLGRLAGWLTRCSFVIYSVCFSLVKMVYFFRLIVSLSMVALSVVTLAPNEKCQAMWRLLYRA
jgi:hypothetical protein